MRFDPPHPNLPDLKDIDVSTAKFDKSNPKIRKYYEKYDPKAPQNVKKRRADRKRKIRSWLAQNWIALSSLIIAIAALIVAIVK